MQIASSSETDREQLKNESGQLQPAREKAARDRKAFNEAKTVFERRLAHGEKVLEEAKAKLARLDEERRQVEDLRAQHAAAVTQLDTSLATQAHELEVRAPGARYRHRRAPRWSAPGSTKSVTRWRTPAPGSR